VPASNRTARSGAAWLLRLALVAAGIAISFAIDSTIIAPVVLLFVLVVPF
jgi:hypothetical protein